MKIPLENVPKVIANARLAVLALALVCMFVLDLPVLAIVLALAVVLFRFAMRSNAFNRRVLEFLTGATISKMGDPLPNLSTGKPQTPQAPAPQAATPMDPSVIAQIIDRMAEPAIRLKRHWPPEAPYEGNSWLGGTPALPEGLSWPINPETGFALHHLAQIDLSDMPRLDSGAHLPETGMLWFFADIGEDMDWPAEPDNKATRVLFHPHSTRGAAPAIPPDTLPHVNHLYDKPEAAIRTLGGPRFSVYPRWPVTAHVTTAWPFSDQHPQGVSDPFAYFEALQAREKEEKTKICGPDIQQDYGIKIISEDFPETRTRADGTNFEYNMPTYTPEKWGGRFPYSNRLALHVLAWKNNEMTSRLIDAERGIFYAEKREEEPSQRHIETRDTLTPLMPKLHELIHRLESEPKDAELTEANAQSFDALYGASFTPFAIVSGASGFAQHALIDITAEAMSDPSVLDPLPAGVRDCVAPTTHPSHHYTEHFLLGPKSAASNPTEGKGIRLAQFDSDHALRFMFCDAGIIDFWISEGDLAAGRWERAWGATAGG